MGRTCQSGVASSSTVSEFVDRFLHGKANNTGGGWTAPTRLLDLSRYLGEACVLIGGEARIRDGRSQVWDVIVRNLIGRK